VHISEYVEEKVGDEDLPSNEAVMMEITEQRLHIVHR
jgi:hypothetical protein